MIYQFVLFDQRNFIVEHKAFDVLDQAKLIDYCAARLDQLKPKYRFEVTLFEGVMPTLKTVNHG